MRLSSHLLTNRELSWLAHAFSLAGVREAVRARR